jgi:hypothetical protein
MGWPLPGYAHIPGRTSTADAQLEQVLAEMDRHEDRLAQRCLYGCQLFEAGFYWEAHEAWEPVWHAARPNSAAALLIQAAIALANAALKIRMQQPRAARRLTSRAHSLLAGCPPAAELEKLQPDRLTELANWLAGDWLDNLAATSQKQEGPVATDRATTDRTSTDRASKDRAKRAADADCAARLAQLAAGLSLQAQ